MKGFNQKLENGYSILICMKSFLHLKKKSFCCYTPNNLVLNICIAKDLLP